MKELSLEEKARAYDGAIETARKINSGEGVEAPPDWTICEVIFPELKESEISNEDEKIRRAIIEGLKEMKSSFHTISSIKIDDAIAWIEKQGEQNRVESSKEDERPKFHEGEWIVWNDKFYKVNYNGCGYELIDQNGLHTSLEYGTIDENAHIFSIADAKAGDILVDMHGNIGIFQECEDVFWHSYIYLGCDGTLRWFSIGGSHEQTDTHPATKEQSDNIMKAITDAGYTFDFEKKELKEIEQNSAKWSEEDERIYYSLLADIRARQNGSTSTLEEYYKKQIDWLKSLKQRYTWKPSKEQIDALDLTLQYGKVSDNSFEHLNSLYNDLKKLTE